MTIIKGSNGQTKGRLIENETRITLYDINGKMLGFYSKRQNRTFTATGTNVGTENQLATLLN